MQMWQWNHSSTRGNLSLIGPNLIHMMNRSGDQSNGGERVRERKLVWVAVLWGSQWTSNGHHHFTTWLLHQLRTWLAWMHCHPGYLSTPSRSTSVVCSVCGARNLVTRCASSVGAGACCPAKHKPSGYSTLVHSFLSPYQLSAFQIFYDSIGVDLFYMENTIPGTFDWQIALKWLW